MIGSGGVESLDAPDSGNLLVSLCEYVRAPAQVGGSQDAGQKWEGY